MNRSRIKSNLTDRNFLIFLIATIGMLPALLAFGGYYIKGDITYQMLPFVYETKRMFSSGVPFWSWNTYFGDNFIASYAYYTVFNPFTWINCLFPYRYLGVGFTIVLYLKFLLCGYVSQKYLRKMGFDGRLSLMGCLLYTFSSWAVTNLHYYMFMEPMILFPFLLIFEERLLRKEAHAYSGLAMATFVVVTVNFYYAPANLIAGAIFFLFRLFFMYKEKAVRINTILRAAGCVAVGIICSSVVLIPVLIKLMGLQLNTLTPDSLNIMGVADRLFWLLYPKVKEGASYYLYLGSGNTSHAAGIAVFGLLPTLLLFTKKGYGWIKWLTGTMIFIYLTQLNGIFSLFTEFDYTRWAYCISLLIIICTLYYLKNFGLPCLKYAVWYCIIVYGLFFIFSIGSAVRQYFLNIYIPDIGVEKLILDAVLVAINAIALLVVCSKSTSRGLGKSTAILPSIVLCTALQFSMFSYLGSEEDSPDNLLLAEYDYFRYHEDFRADGNFSYRTNFNLLQSSRWDSSNFGLITGRPSIATFHSVQNVKMQGWDDIASDGERRVIRPMNFVRSFEALMSVKDLALPSLHCEDTTSYGTFMGRNGHFTLFESDHYIPMGFAYDRYIISEEVEALSSSDRDVDIPGILLSAIAVDKDDVGELSPFLEKGVIDVDANLDSLVSARKAVACDRFTGHTRGFDAHICLDSTAVVFFSVLADAGFTAYVDDEPTKIYEVNLGFSSVVVPAGCHDISFRYFPPGLGLGLLLSAIGFLITGVVFFKEKSSSGS